MCMGAAMAASGALSHTELATGLPLWAISVAMVSTISWRAAASRQIGVAFNDSNGFRAPLVHLPPAGLSSLAAADFNRDGHNDVAVGGVILLGNGRGRLLPAATFTTMTPDQLRTGDFDRDGNADILTTAVNVNGVFVFLGQGDGTFRPPLGPFLDDTDLWPEIGDFNNDGVLDAAIAHVFGDTLTILLGTGNGSLIPAADYATGDIPQSPVASDFDGDGNLDVAVSNTFGDGLGIYLGNGDGTLQSPLLIATSNPLYSAAGDFNQDGNSDLVLGGSGLKLFLGYGNGTFQPPQTLLSGYEPISIGDADGDGLSDIMVSEDFASLTLLRSKGDGTFKPGIPFPTGEQFVGWNVLTDLNGDGRPEAVAENLDDAVTVLKNISR